jgi:hypothetical protein
LKGVAMIGIILLLLLIVGGSLVGGTIISSQLRPKNATAQTNHTILNTTGDASSFDLVSWIMSAPIIPFVKNMVDGFKILTGWFIIPLSAVVCTMIRAFNPASVCWHLSGLLLFIPFLIAGVWGAAERAHKWLMLIAITFIIIFVIGVVLVLLGAIH